MDRFVIFRAPVGAINRLIREGDSKSRAIEIPLRIATKLPPFRAVYSRAEIASCTPADCNVYRCRVGTAHHLLLSGLLVGCDQPTD